MAGRHAKKAPPRVNHRTRRWIVGASVLTFLIAGSTGAYHALTRPMTRHQPTTFHGQNITVNATPPEEERTNILLMGTDNRPGDTGGNSDVLVLCSIDRKHKRIEILSIPRDTKVLLPDGTSAKINEGLSLGGPALTESLVQSLVEQPIDHYALTYFGGLVNIINTIGGVTVDVKQRMYYNTGDAKYNIINLRKGTHTLTGEQALGYVRFRHDALGDIGRTERQQEFLKALSEKLLEPQNITKLPTLVREVWGAVDSDLSVLDVAGLASKGKQFQGYQFIHETLPGSFHDPDPNIKNDVSYWVVNPKQAKYAAKQFFEDGVVVKNPIQDPAVTRDWTPPVPVPPPATTTNSTAEDGTTTPTDSAGTAASMSPTEMTCTGYAYVRSGPGPNYDVISYISSGESVTVIGVSRGWYQVQLAGGATGYVTPRLLSPRRT